MPGLCALAADADSGGGGGPGGGGGGTSHWHWSHSDGASHISYGESLMEYTERRLSDSTIHGYSTEEEGSLRDDDGRPQAWARVALA